jgi:hypothetical protein
LTVHIAYDDTAISLIPKDATTVAAYVDGRFANFTAAKEAFPHAQLVSISVVAGGKSGARFVDCEPGDLTPQQGAQWAKRERNAKRVPGIYASVDNIPAVVVELAKLGVARRDVVWWSAHYTTVEHICGPATCGALAFNADGTQYTDSADGRSLDASAVTDRWLDPTPKPTPKPVPRGHAIANVGFDLQAGVVSWVHGLPNPGVHFTHRVDQWLDVNVQINARDGAWRPK